MNLECFRTCSSEQGGPSDPLLEANTGQSAAECVVALRAAADRRRGCLAVLAGDDAPGKTSVLKVMMRTQDPGRYRTVFLAAADLGPATLLQEIFTQVEDEPCRETNTDRLRDRLHRLLDQTHDARKVLIAIEGVEALSPEGLDDLFHLAECHKQYGGRLSLILAGRPDLLKRLERPTREHPGLLVDARCQLAAIDPREAMGDADEPLLGETGRPGGSLNAVGGQEEAAPIEAQAESLASELATEQLKQCTQVLDPFEAWQTLRSRILHDLRRHPLPHHA